jgi:hypothetical protein
MDIIKKEGCFSDESVAFQERMLMQSGVGPSTAWPPGILKVRIGSVALLGLLYQHCIASSPLQSHCIYIGSRVIDGSVLLTFSSNRIAVVLILHYIALWHCMALPLSLPLPLLLYYSDRC